MNLRHLSSAMLFFMVMEACSSTPGQELGVTSRETKIGIRIDSRLAPRWRDTVNETARQWGVLLRGAVEFEVYEEIGFAFFKTNTIDLCYSAEEHMKSTLARTDRYERDDGRTLTARIHVFEEGVDNDARLWVCLHEMGHALGLPHDMALEHDSVMWPKISYPIKLGCEDWRRTCALWGCTAWCEGQAWL